jgi:hypothetical protein
VEGPACIGPENTASSAMVAVSMVKSLHLDKPAAYRSALMWAMLAYP